MPDVETNTEELDEDLNSARNVIEQAGQTINTEEQSTQNQDQLGDFFNNLGDASNSDNGTDSANDDDSDNSDTSDDDITPEESELAKNVINMGSFLDYPQTGENINIAGYNSEVLNTARRTVRNINLLRNNLYPNSTDRHWLGMLSTNNYDMGEIGKTLLGVDGRSPAKLWYDFDSSANNIGIPKDDPYRHEVSDEIASAIVQNRLRTNTQFTDEEHNILKSVGYERKSFLKKRKPLNQVQINELTEKAFQIYKEAGMIHYPDGMSAEDRDKYEKEFLEHIRENFNRMNNLGLTDSVYAAYKVTRSEKGVQQMVDRFKKEQATRERYGVSNEINYSDTLTRKYYETMRGKVEEQPEPKVEEKKAEAVKEENVKAEQPAQTVEQKQEVKEEKPAQTKEESKADVTDKKDNAGAVEEKKKEEAKKAEEVKAKEDIKAKQNNAQTQADKAVNTQNQQEKVKEDKKEEKSERVASKVADAAISVATLKTLSGAFKELKNENSTLTGKDLFNEAVKRTGVGIAKSDNYYSNSGEKTTGMDIKNSNGEIRGTKYAVDVKDSNGNLQRVEVPIWNNKYNKDFNNATAKEMLSATNFALKGQEEKAEINKKVENNNAIKGDLTADNINKELEKLKQNAINHPYLKGNELLQKAAEGTAISVAEHPTKDKQTGTYSTKIIVSNDKGEAIDYPLNTDKFSEMTKVVSAIDSAKKDISEQMGSNTPSQTEIKQQSLASDPDEKVTEKADEVKAEAPKEEKAENKVDEISDDSFDAMFEEGDANEEVKPTEINVKSANESVSSNQPIEEDEDDDLGFSDADVATVASKPKEEEQVNNGDTQAAEMTGASEIEDHEESLAEKFAKNTHAVNATAGLASLLSSQDNMQSANESDEENDSKLDMSDDRVQNKKDVGYNDSFDKKAETIDAASIGLDMNDIAIDPKLCRNRIDYEGRVYDRILEGKGTQSDSFGRQYLNEIAQKNGYQIKEGPKDANGCKQVTFIGEKTAVNIPYTDKQGKDLDRQTIKDITQTIKNTHNEKVAEKELAEQKVQQSHSQSKGISRA